MSGSDTEAVGYKRPPKHTRFQPGKSGNPRGRPKGTRNFKTELEEELAETIRVREGDRELKVTKQRAVLKTLVGRALKGDARAAHEVLSLVGRYVGVGEEEIEEEAKIEYADRAILDRYYERRRQKETIEQSVKEADNTHEVKL